MSLYYDISPCPASIIFHSEVGAVARAGGPCILTTAVHFVLLRIPDSIMPNTENLSFGTGCTRLLLEQWYLLCVVLEKL